MQVASFFSYSLIRYPILKRSHSANSYKIGRCFYVSQTENQPPPILRLIKKGVVVEEKVDDFLKATAAFSKVHFDLGTGDGKFVYQQAKKDSGTFYVGVEPCPGAMCHVSQKVAKKPSRGGGMTNVAFIQSFIETLPLGPPAIADSISINFPWSTLLKAVVIPVPPILSKIARLGKDGSSIEILINYSIFNNKEYLKKIELLPLDEDYVKTFLYPEYLHCGIKIKSYQFTDVAKNKSKWGQHLTLGAGRKVLLLTGKIEHKSLD